ATGDHRSNRCYRQYRWKGYMTLLVARCQPQVPTTAEYEDLKAHFQPIFDEIASGAKDRELNGQRPVDQIEQLNAAGFSVLRVPRSTGVLGPVCIPSSGY